MRPAILLLLMQLAAGCAFSGAAPPPTSGEAMCHELEPLARDHAAALAEGGDNASVATGQALLAGLAAGCSWEVPQ
jgi:hypothetical protein